MRKFFILILAVVLTAGFYTIAFAGTIVGSKHDFSSSGDSGGQGYNISAQICNVCHTPHNADTSVGNAPLWNHDVTTETSFTLYTGSGTLDATPGQPGGISKLCLSCHDGTVALDSFGGATGTSKITGDALIGIDLDNDHPVSFTYNAALVTADGELADPGSIGMPLFGTSKDQLECATCHDVHDDANSPFLRIANTSSGLCLTCHTK